MNQALKLVTESQLVDLSQWEMRKLILALKERYTPQEIRTLYDQVRTEFRQRNPHAAHMLAVAERDVPRIRSPKKR